jgi:hypothetical protein
MSGLCGRVGQRLPGGSRVLLSLLVVAFVWVLPAGALAATPAVTVTAPTATASWPSGSTQTVSWTVSPAYAAVGEFRVGLLSAPSASSASAC